MGSIGRRAGFLPSAVLVLLGNVVARPAAAATLPPGFTETSVGGLSAPTAMALAPDGRIFVCEQGGALRVIKNGVLLPTPFASLSVNSSNERGLLGVAFDPGFAGNQYVYVYYTTASSPIHNRISRFTANGDVAVAGSELVLLDLNNLTATNHNGGAIHFGPDGKLYAGVGENAIGSNAQSLNNLLGKILRINSDGSIPTDNPFYLTATGQNRAIWALGLRNPYTFDFQRGTGRLFINDVGAGTWEEIDDGIAGANYGWPQTEGPDPPGSPGVTYPIYFYDHDGSTCAITGGAFYNPVTAQFPEGFTGHYFFADLCAGWIHVLDPTSLIATDFATGIDTPVDIKVGPDGSLYYLARGSGEVFRVEYPHATTIGVYRPADHGFCLRNTNASGVADLVAYYGIDGDIPLAGDWDGDGIDTIGVYRPSNHAFYLRNSNTSGRHDILVFYGIDGDVPLVGDWNGDGIDTVGVYRPSNHAFYLRNSNTSGGHNILVFYGIAGDIPVVGDWNGDGSDTVGIYRPSNHGFYLRNSNTSGRHDLLAFIGIDGDEPVIGDWNGDGVDSIGVYRSSNHAFYMRNSNSSGTHQIPVSLYGIDGDIPLTGNWDGR